MRHTLKPLLRAGPHYGTRVAGAVRAGTELALFAAVAAGCAQAGLVLLAPGQAQAGAVARDRGATAQSVAATAPVATPFAPGLGDGDVAAAAALQGIELTGLRVGAGSVRGGAILSLPQGGQQAFLVGQDISPGLTLTAVTADGATLSFAGGDHTLSLAQVTGHSYARALMGLEPEATSDATQSLSAADFGPAERDWLAATFASPVRVDGVVTGYRLAGAAPPAATGAGVQAGDVVEAVNGVPAADPMGMIAAVQAGGSLDLRIRRQDGAVTTVRLTLPEGASLERLTP